MVLGDADKSSRLLKGRKTDLRQQTEARRLAMATRPSCEEMVGATEEISGRPWLEAMTRQGDWGRNGMLR